MMARMRPMLATRGSHVPTGPEWSHEIKWDGMRILADVRAKGYGSIQDELDYGIVSVALPIFGPNGRVVAAANCSDVTNRLDRPTMIKKRLPLLRQAVLRIEGMLAQHPELKAELQSQIDLDNNITFVSNERLQTALERTNIPPAKIKEAVRINEEARLRALKIGLLIMAALSLLAIFPAGRLPDYKPGEIPANPPPPKPKREDELKGA